MTGRRAKLRTVTSLAVSAVAGHHAMPAALLFCITTGISHRVQLAILVNFPNKVLVAKRF